MSAVLSRDEARKLALFSQGLSSSGIPSGKIGALASLERLGYVQIDTISVVERAHHHVLWSRQPDYHSAYLDALVDDKLAFEYWSHAAAYLPMKEYRYTLPQKHRHLQNKSQNSSDRRMKEYVLERIQAEGALMARDFEHSRTTGGWWEHKPAKRALEQLFFEGKLMIARRINFQKTFDITERVLPPTVDRSMPSPDEVSLRLVYSAINAHGFANIEEMSYLRGGDQRKSIQNIVRDLTENGDLTPVMVQDCKKKYYSTSENLNAVGLYSASTFHILSPFDNAAIQRQRLRDLWDFDYQIECYVPAAKRKFGYFCLPILQGNCFIGRIDAKADRKTKRLIINSLHIEKTWTEDFTGLSTSMFHFAKFNGCTTVEIAATYPQKIKKPLEKALSLHKF